MLGPSLCSAEGLRYRLLVLLSRVGQRWLVQVGVEQLVVEGELTRLHGKPVVDQGLQVLGGLDGARLRGVALGPNGFLV